MNKLDKIFSVAIWIQNFISPFLTGIIVSFLIWLSTQSLMGEVLVAIVMLVGILLGVRLAEKERKKV